MNGLTLSSATDLSATLVPTVFIDYYMPSANGSFVKVYLYLLRCMDKIPEAFSLSYLADQLEETEKDILRALRYWEKAGILKLHKEKDGSLSSICLLTPKKPEKKTEAPRGELPNDEDLKWIATIVENYMERPLTPTDYRLLEYLYGDLHFSAELIFYLYEHCISKNKKSASYIEAVAVSWSKQGITTAEEAEAASLSYTQSYTMVMKAFGLNRMPGAAERQYIDRWTSGLELPSEVILEACNRTLLNTQKPDFKYCNRILTNWHEKGVTGLNDIKELDNRFTASKEAKPLTAEVQPKTSNRFHGYPQRSYTKDDYSHLEKQLLSK
jgi:DnaD/phage-associated family protein